MANQKISQLTDGSPVQSGDQFVINRSGANFRVSGLSALAWSSLTSASGNLALSNGTNTTEFDQTSNTIWKWYNTTTATSGTTNASPVLDISANYWTGSASAEDKWTLGSSLAAGTNGASTLTIGHSGSSGSAIVVIPAGASNAASLQLSGASGAGLWGTSSQVNLDYHTNGGSVNFYYGSTKMMTFTNAGSVDSINAADTGFSLRVQGNVTSQASAGTALGNQSNFTAAGSGTFARAADILGTFSPASGSSIFAGLNVNPTINQSGSSSGSYTGLLVNVVETSLKGASNKLIDLQAGSTGGTSKFSITNAGHIRATTDTAGQATITAGNTTVSVSFGANYTGASQPVIIITPTSDPTVAGVVQGAWITYSGGTGAWTGFVINIQAALAADCVFNYIAIDQI